MSDSKTIQTPDVSIIVPVFNAERFLEGSIGSARNQSHTKLEIICIDDASEDASPTILKEYSDLDDRIRVIHLRQNEGVGSARNHGIDAARGRYLFFLDSDDSMPSDALENLLHASRQAEVDMIVGRYLRFENASDVELEEPFRQSTPEVTITDVYTSKFLQSIPVSHCCKLYLRSFLANEHIRYDADLTYGEDQLFQAKSIIRSNKVALIDSIVYFYHHYRNESLTRKLPTLKNLLDEIEYRRRMVEEFLAVGLEKQGLRLLKNWFYCIHEYWSQIPEAISVEDARHLFDQFRSLMAKYEIDPWIESTPRSHRHLLELVISGLDERAYAYLRRESMR